MDKQYQLNTVDIVSREGLARGIQNASREAL